MIGPRLFQLASLAVLATLAAQVPAPDAGEDWPCFLGLRQDGTSRETILKKWPTAGPPRLWTRPVGNAYSAPVVARGRMIAFHRVSDEEVLECLAAQTGKPLWSFRYPTAYEDRYGYNNGPRSSPAIDGERVYSYGAEGKLTCLDFESGRLVWQRAVNAEYRVLPAHERYPGPFRRRVSRPEVHAPRHR